jgi:hypothetical protein
MTYNLSKLTLDTYFEYTDDENDVLWFETFMRFAQDKFMLYKVEHFISKILKEKIQQKCGEFVQKMKFERKIILY